jgi:hypothetical protein
MNELHTAEPPPQPQPPERRVKSVNFPDAALLDFANQRAEGLYGGNFSAYMIALVERDRALGESRRFLHDLEAGILEVIRPLGGRASAEGETFDFEIPRLGVIIVARSRFPRERHLEYQLLSAMQKIAVTSPNTRIVVVYPADIPEPEKDRFKQFEAAGIEGLRVGDLEATGLMLGEIAQGADE